MTKFIEKTLKFDNVKEIDRKKKKEYVMIFCITLIEEKDYFLWFKDEKNIKFKFGFDGKIRTISEESNIFQIFETAGINGEKSMTKFIEKTLKFDNVKE